MEDFIHTVLIHAWQQARRPRKRMGSVACTEQGSGSGITRSQPTISVSHKWLKVYFLEDEIQRGVNRTRCHTVINVSSQRSCESMQLLLSHPTSWSASNEEVNGIESRPKYDKSSFRCNCGIASVGAVEWFHSPAWRRSSHITQGSHRYRCSPRWPVMGPAVGQPSTDQIGGRYKSPAMGTKAETFEGKENSLCILARVRKEEC